EGVHLEHAVGRHGAARPAAEDTRAGFGLLVAVSDRKARPDHAVLGGQGLEAVLPVLRRQLGHKSAQVSGPSMVLSSPAAARASSLASPVPIATDSVVTRPSENLMIRRASPPYTAVRWRAPSTLAY